MDCEELEKLWRLHHAGPGLQLNASSGLSATVQPARETVTALLRLAFAGLCLREALKAPSAIELSNARQHLRNHRRRATDKNVADEIISARRANYSVYWSSP